MNHRIIIHWCFPGMVSREAMSAKLPQASQENATAIRSRDLNAARIPKSSTSRPHLQSRSWRCWKCLCKALMLLAAISMPGLIGKTHKHHHQRWFINIGVSLVKLGISIINIEIRVSLKIKIHQHHHHPYLPSDFPHRTKRRTPPRVRGARSAAAKAKPPPNAMD